MTDADNKYEDWIKKIQEASGLKSEEKETKNSVLNSKEKKSFNFDYKQNKISIIAPILVFLLAIIPRVYFLFFVSDPQNAGVGWYGDTYHHWQIAYLTKEIGLSHGFLRLWDLKGMEYFWGLLHPFVLMNLMSVFGSTDIIITRLLSLFTGSASVLVLYLIAKRYWGGSVAIAAAIFGALNPVSVFNDASGMVEPVGMLFLFLAIYYWPLSPILTGVFFTLASMARAEFWLFSIGLVFVILIFSKERFDKKIVVILSYVVLIAFYMKYLLNYTGNAIYPIWWNFLGNAKGEWQADIPLSSVQEAVQPIWIGIFVVSVLGSIYVLWKKPKGILLHLLGLGSFMFIGGFVGLTAYIKSYVHYFWVVRIFSLQYLYLGLFVAIVLFILIPKIIPFYSKLRVGWIFVLALILASQFAWNVIWRYYKPTIGYWNEEIKLAKEIGGTYKDGTVLIHEGDPVMVYALVKYTKIKGKNIQGQMYDPFQYKPFSDYSDPFEKWNKDRKLIVKWLKRDNIKLLVIHFQRERYLELIRREPEIFKFIKDTRFGMKIYEVTL